MQAITTRYIGPTATKPGRIKAFCEAGSVTVSYSFEHDVEGEHRVAAMALVAKLGWTEYGALIAGGTKDGYVFVFASPTPEITALFYRCEMQYPHFESGGGLECLNAARVQFGLRAVNSW